MLAMAAIVPVPSTASRSAGVESVTPAGFITAATYGGASLTDPVADTGPMVSNADTTSGNGTNAGDVGKLVVASHETVNDTKVPMSGLNSGRVAFKTTGLMAEPVPAPEAVATGSVMISALAMLGESTIKTANIASTYDIDFRSTIPLGSARVNSHTLHPTKHSSKSTANLSLMKLSTFPPETVQLIAHFERDVPVLVRKWAAAPKATVASESLCTRDYGQRTAESL